MLATLSPPFLFFMPLVSLIRTKDYYSVFKEHQAVLRPAKVKAKATRYIPVEIQGPTLS